MHVTVISLNGLQELSGGGLYLRSLVSGLAQAEGVRQVQVIGKAMGGQVQAFEDARVSEVELEKNTRTDVLARMRGHPTFLGYYLDRIVRQSAGSDLIVLHNSRGGRILRRLRAAYPRKKYILCSDNVEFDLQRQKARSLPPLRRPASMLEQLEIRRAEAQAHAADLVAFITEADRTLFEQLYGRPSLTDILPITVRDPFGGACEVPGAGDGSVLFTGHFGFAPNQDALAVLHRVASAVNRGRGPHEVVRFVVAGAGLDRLPAPQAPGVTYHAAPGIQQMDALFRAASLYLAPVLWGSGMKTKVAEALSYGLPVIALPHACTGYEDAIRRDDGAMALALARTDDELVALLEARHRALDPRQSQRARDIYLASYSTAAQAARFTRIFNRILQVEP
ncbi:glycosyltransferase [Castellaniella sp.]|uniref:glycosyltransferase n=1 Tax=Castellaniella sp. TaxID=1955812 RepID=UPI003568E260